MIIMNDQAWAVIIGAATVIVLRIVDFFFPKGKWFTWGGNVDTEKEALRVADAAEDADTDVKRREKDRGDDTRRRDRDERLEDEGG